MDVLLFTDGAFALHETGRGHPERPERLGALVAGVQDSPANVDVRQPEPASRSALELVHDTHYVDLIERICKAGGGELDADTSVVASSWPAALLAAGSGLSAIEALRSGEGDLAVCAVRPPGHHARRAQAMGFCIFNNAAVAAAHLVSSGKRVAIVDWDVHHGNGTQETFFESADVLYVSIHEWGSDPDSPSSSFYPGTGWLDEVGSGPGRGATINVPVPAATTGDLFRNAFSDLIAPAVAHFDADWLLVSAGFDAHAADPLAHLGLVADDYMAMAAAIARHPGRTVLFAEGGYDLVAVSQSMSASLAGFGGGQAEPSASKSPETAWRLMEQARQMAVESGGL
jgi:acetoin utilization deacetylase AcuC-like enzyme